MDHMNLLTATEFAPLIIFTVNVLPTEKSFSRANHRDLLPVNKKIDYPHIYNKKIDYPHIYTSLVKLSDCGCGMQG